MLLMTGQHKAFDALLWIPEQKCLHHRNTQNELVSPGGREHSWQGSKDCEGLIYILTLRTGCSSSEMMESLPLWKKGALWKKGSEKH